MFQLIAFIVRMLAKIPGKMGWYDSSPNGPSPGVDKISTPMLGVDILGLDQDPTPPPPPRKLPPPVAKNRVERHNTHTDTLELPVVEPDVWANTVPQSMLATDQVPVIHS